MRITHTNHNDPGRTTITIDLNHDDDPRGALAGLVLHDRLADALAVLARPDLGAPETTGDVERMLSTVSYVASLANARLSELMHLAADVYDIPVRTIATQAETSTTTAQRRIDTIRTSLRNAGMVRSPAGLHPADEEPGAEDVRPLPEMVTPTTPTSNGMTVGHLLASPGVELGLLPGEEPAYLAEGKHVYIGAFRSGHGTTTMTRTILAQALHHGHVVMALGDKAGDHRWMAGHPGVHRASDPDGIQDALRWLNGELDRRDTGQEYDPRPRIWLAIDNLPILYRREQKATKRPLSRALGSIFNGRGDSGVTVLATGHGADVAAEPRTGFDVRILALTPQGWRAMAPDVAPVPALSAIPGRWHLLGTPDSGRELQALYFTPEEARDHADNGTITEFPTTN